MHIFPAAFGKQDFLQHTTPEGNDPELFKLITAQATIRMALEGKWLEEYVAYLEHEEEKKRELQKNWEAERLSRLLRRKELERAKNKVGLGGHGKGVWLLHIDIIHTYTA